MGGSITCTRHSSTTSEQYSLGGCSVTRTCFHALRMCCCAKWGLGACRPPSAVLVCRRPGLLDGLLSRNECSVLTHALCLPETCRQVDQREPLAPSVPSLIKCTSLPAVGAALTPCIFAPGCRLVDQLESLRALFECTSPPAVGACANMAHLPPSECRLVDQLESLAPSVPSLIDCTSLTVKGPVRFEGGVAIRGDVTLTNGAFGVVGPSVSRNADADQQWVCFCCVCGVVAVCGHL